MAMWYTHLKQYRLSKSEMAECNTYCFGSFWLVLLVVLAGFGWFLWFWLVPCFSNYGSKWLDISQVLFFACLWTETESAHRHTCMRVLTFRSEFLTCNVILCNYYSGFRIWKARVRKCNRFLFSSPKGGSWSQAFHV